MLGVENSNAVQFALSMSIVKDHFISLGVRSRWNEINKAGEEKITLPCGRDGRVMKLQAAGADVANDLLCLEARRDNERGLAFGHAIEVIEYVNKEDLPASLTCANLEKLT
jgi:hypothetical protein